MKTEIAADVFHATLGYIMPEGFYAEFQKIISFPFMCAISLMTPWPHCHSCHAGTIIHARPKAAKITKTAQYGNLPPIVIGFNSGTALSGGAAR
ncbi:MAG: hypothetical protein ACREE2_00845 [Stellaceae bacterium]